MAGKRKGYSVKRRPPLVRCRFCRDAADVSRCTWSRALVPTVIHHSRLTMDDTIVTKGGKELRPLTVQRFSYVESGYWRLSVTMYAVNYGRDKYFLFYCAEHKGVTVLRPGACGNPCCERHRCERGPKTVYCMDHWRSWETAA